MLKQHRIGLISDPHATPAVLEQALALFSANAVTEVLCAGDIAGYFDEVSETVALLEAADCDCVVGNHDLSYLAEPDRDAEVASYLSGLPRFREYELAGCRLYLVHAEPPNGLHGGIKLLDESGQLIPERVRLWQEKLAGFSADVLIVGHTHQVYDVQLGNTLLINPGSLPFNHCCMILELPEKRVRRFAVGQEDIVACWNFGMQFRDSRGDH